MKLNEKQIELVKSKISELFKLDELCYGTTSFFDESGIEYYLFEQYSHNFRAIYCIVPIKSGEQFLRLDELKRIAKRICKEKNANVAYHSTCQFSGDEIVSIEECNHQYFNPIKPK